MILDSGYLISATGPRALAQFLEQFGHAPERCFRSGRTWRAGPVDGNENAQRGALGRGRGNGDCWLHDEPTRVHCTAKGTR